MRNTATLATPAAAGSSRSALSGLARAQGDLLASLRDPGSADSSMLTTMMMSNVLLELSKLAMARLSLAEFANSVLGAFLQCAPIDSAAVVFAPSDLPRVRATVGEWPIGDDDSNEIAGVAEGVHVAPITESSANVTIGYLGLCGAPQGLIDAGLVERAAEHLSSMLGLLVEAERLRRAAAASRALELIGGLDAGFDEEALFDIAAALQMLPGAEGATILTELPRFAGPLLVESGVVGPEGQRSEHRQEIERRGSVTATIFWSSAGEPHDSRFAEITTRLGAAIARSEQTARLLEEIEVDALTGIGNRRRASRALAQARARCARDGEQFTVLMMDLDKFKSVNDTYGHSVGDEVLCAFARAIEKVVRSYDISARWGGEEFVLVCPSTGSEGGASIARRLLAETPLMCEPAFPDGHQQTVSIGIAVGGDPAVDPLEVLRQADAALYDAKRNGRNQFALATPGRRENSK
jgi:diguanylate cyclase (GGDEF)-like protein